MMTDLRGALASEREDGEGRHKKYEIVSFMQCLQRHCTLTALLRSP